MIRKLGSAKVVQVSLDEPLRPVEVGRDDAEVLLVVTSQSAVIDEVALPAVGTMAPELLRQIVLRRSGDRLWRQGFKRGFTMAASSGEPERERPPQPTVSVVITTHDRRDEVERCLKSLYALDRQPDEIVVVDYCPSDESTRILCELWSVRYVREPVRNAARARNRGIVEATGDLIAFIEDDAVADHTWLNEVERAFSDPLVFALVGYTAPLELRTPAQRLFYFRSRRNHSFDPTIVGGLRGSPILIAAQVGGSRNMVVRRSALPADLLTEDFGGRPSGRDAAMSDLSYRLLLRGHRIAVYTSRIVWQRYPRSLNGLLRFRFGRLLAMSAFATRCFLGHREPGAVKQLGRSTRQVARELSRCVRRNSRRLPLRIVLAEVLGLLLGPPSLVRGKLEARRREPIRLVRQPAERRPAARIVVEESDPPISVVVPSRNRKEYLEKVLDALADQTYPHERYEVVVVLDGSTDGSAEMARSLELPYTLRVFEQDRGSAGATRNRGVAEAANPVAALLDDDLFAYPGFVAAHARAHAQARRPHAALGYAEPIGAGDGYWGLGTKVWWEDFYKRLADPNHRSIFIDLVTANVSLPRSVLLEHKFDESFPGRGREDWELGVRLLEHGISFGYYPGAAARHDFDGRFATALRQSRKDAQLDVLFASKHPGIAPHLTLRAFFDDVDNLLERLERTCRNPDARSEYVHRWLPLLDLLERRKLRKRWNALKDWMLGEQYVVGLADALGSPANAMEFATSLWDAAEVVTVQLDVGRTDLPRPQTSEVAVSLGGKPLGRVAGAEPLSVWNWDRVAQRAVDWFADDARRLTVLEELEREWAVVERSEHAEVIGAD